MDLVIGEEDIEEIRRRSPLIFFMDENIFKQLCSILDQGFWIELAPSMLDISVDDVEGCKKHKMNDGSPSAYLLRIWSSKGYKIVDLYCLFAINRLVRCMKVIRSQVDSRLLYLEGWTSLERCSDPARPKAQTVTSYHLPHGSSAMATGGCSSVPSTSRQSATPISRSTLGTPSAFTNTNTPPSTSHFSSDDAIMFSGMRNTPSVRYDELLAATDNFSSNNIIGKGGYGVVYKGEWKQTQVAVKRLSSQNDRSHRLEKERLRQSLQELNTLASKRHDNILPVYGYSLDGPEPCLVYQFMANGSLDDRLQCKKGTPPLSWGAKLNIARGSATGLNYLHTVGLVPLIHGDVKTGNILLDKHWEPKLGDFGLSREGQPEMDVEDKNVLIASHIKGTLAYLPPEFIASKILTTKLDVYSFGVVLLEIATGLRAYTDSREPASLVDFCASANALITPSGRKSRSIFLQYADKRTPSTNSASNDEDIFNVLWTLGIECSLKERNERPSFMHVINQLRLV